MAYMNQERKAAIRELLSKAIPQSWKWSLAVQNHSTIVLTISAAPLDLVTAYAQSCIGQMREYIERERWCDVNPHHWRDHFEEGDARRIFEQIFQALNLNNHDRSDAQTDYFDVGHYVAVNLGRWNKPFVVISEADSPPR